MTTRREFIRNCGLVPFVGGQLTSWLHAFEKAGSAGLRELCVNSLQKTYACDPSKCLNGHLSQAVQTLLDKELYIFDRLNLTASLPRLWVLSAYLEAKRIPFLLRGPGNTSLVIFASGLGRVCQFDHGILIERLFVGGSYLILAIPPEDESEVKEFVQNLFQSSEPRLGPLKIGYWPTDSLSNLKKYSQTDWTNCPLDDAKTFQLLQSGETEGIYKLESEELQSFLRLIRPESLADVMACINLYRTDPLANAQVREFIRRRNDEIPPVFPHPVLEEILTETRGILLYHEQVIQLLHRLGGMSLFEACELGKELPMAKDKVIPRIRDLFLANAANLRMSQMETEVCLKLFNDFDAGPFTKADAAAIGTMACCMAFLKANQGDGSSVWC